MGLYLLAVFGITGGGLWITVAVSSMPLVMIVGAAITCCGIAGICLAAREIRELVQSLLQRFRAR